MRRTASVVFASAMALAGLLSGCSVFSDARRAQDDVAAKALALEPRGAGALDFRDRRLSWLVDFAMTNRPSVVAARLAVEDARLALKTLAADAPVVSDTPWTAPKLSLSAGHSESSAGTRLEDHRFSTDGAASAGLSLDLLVWDFGRYEAKAKAQAERVVAAELQLANEGFVVFGEVARAYFTVLEKHALLEVSFTNVAQFAAHLAQAEARLKAGEVNRLDVLRSRLDLANAKERSVAASNDFTTAGAELMRALGVDASRGTFSETFGDLPGGLSRVTRCFEDTHYCMGEAFAFARTNAPALNVSRARLRAAAHDVDAALSDMLPSLSFSTSLSWTDPLWYWKWGVNASQALFQGFRKTTAVDRAVVAMRSAAARVDESEQELSANIELAVAVRDNSVEARRTARALVKSARENLQMVEEQRSVGDVSRIELSDSVSEYSSALGSRVSAFYTAQRAEAALFALLGRYPNFKEETVEIEK